MKKMRRIFLTFFLAVLMAGIGVAAAMVYLHITTVHVSITEGEKKAITYSDAAATIPWYDQDIQLEANHAWVETVYVKNEGTSDITLDMKAQGNTAFGFVMFSPQDPFTLAPGQAQPVEISIYATPGVTPGTYSFSIITYE